MEEEWDVPGLEQRLLADFNLKLPVAKWLEEEGNLDEEQLRERIYAAFKMAYDVKVEQVGEHIIRQFEKGVMLQTLDTSWREHLAAMDYLRQGIHLRGYAQKNPKQEYKREAFELFAQLLDKLNYEVISALSKFEVRVEQDIEAMEARQRKVVNLHNMEYQHAEPEQVSAGAQAAVVERPAVSLLQQPVMRTEPKVGRNDVCPCGSGKKYKQCHGKLD